MNALLELQLNTPKDTPSKVQQENVEKIEEETADEKKNDKQQKP